MIRLDIIADFVCPWCYVGKVLLDQALEAEAPHPFRVEFHPYLLDPGLPPEGMDRGEYLAARFGSGDQIVEIHKPLIALASDYGVPLNLPAITRQPNTVDAHRLSHWAGLEGVQPFVVSTLYRAYWVEGKDISDHAVLREIAVAAGMDRDLVMRLLESEADHDTLTERMRHAKSRGVEAVPTFVVDDHYVISGAQPPALWRQAIGDIRRNSAAGRVETTNGEATNGEVTDNGE